MKKIILPFLIISFFIACKSKTNSPLKDSVANNKSAIDQSAELIKKFKPIIQGVWVKADYIDKVIKTKSPLAAQDIADYITTMYINTDHVKGDSIIVSTVIGNHEGGDAVLKFQPGKSPSTIILGDGDLSYSIENGDTTLMLSQLDETKKLRKTKYVKALNKQADDDNDYGMNYLINKNLISGNYTLTNSLGSKTKVTFNSNGKVSDFPAVKTFLINTAFGDPMSNLDYIVFNFNTKYYASYAFKINADTLNLFETGANADSTELVLGKLKYKLVRQK